MKKPDPEIVSAFVEEVLQDWGVTVLDVLSDKIRQKKLVLTGDLLRSLQFKTLKATQDSTAQLFLTFQESGRIKDMRSANWKKQPPIEEIEAFVRKIGLSKFKYVPGYKKGGKMPTESIAIKRIAWGIARHRKKVNRTKPKKWFAKTFYGMINPLIDNLLDGYREFAAESVKQGLKNG